jgi:hypothetical protein
VNSPAPTTPTKIIPKSVLRIDGDPTQWGLRDVGPAKPSWGAPVQLVLEAPLVGMLVLSPRAGGAAIFPPTPGDGWMPGMRMGFTYLYLPTTSGVHSNSPFYELTEGKTVDQVAQQIADAMSGDGSSLTLEFSSVGQPGYVVINGATLAFAVVGS